MPQAASFAVNDRAGTPVSHTFVPVKGGDDFMTFEETAATPAGSLRYTVSWRRVNGTYRAKVQFAQPIVATETINGVSNPKVVRTNYTECEFKFSELSTLQERRDIVGMFANSLAASVTVLDGVFTKLEGVW